MNISGINQICKWLVSEELHYSLTTVDSETQGGDIDSFADNITNYISATDKTEKERFVSIVADELRELGENDHITIHASLVKIVALMSKRDSEKTKKCVEILSPIAHQALADSKNAIVRFTQTPQDIHYGVIRRLNQTMISRMARVSKVFYPMASGILANRLSIMGISMRLPEGYEFGAENAKKVTALRVDNYDGTFVSMVEVFPNIRKLSLVTTELTNVKIHCLAKLQNLVALVLSSQSFSMPKPMFRLLSRLEELSLIMCELPTESFEDLKELKKLKLLHLCSSQSVDDNALEFIKGLTDLEELSLDDCRNITDNGCLLLKDLTNLKNLNLSGCNYLTQNGLKHLSSFVKLNSLNFCGDSLKTLDNVSMLTNLLKLDLGYNPLNCSAMTQLSVFTGLRSLRLTGCESLELECLSELGQLINLQQLYVGAGLDIKGYKTIKLGDQDLKMLRNLTNLSCLDVQGWENLTDAGLVHLHGMTQLQILSIEGCTKLTEEGIGDIRKRVRKLIT
jgi:hypothetical protein